MYGSRGFQFETDPDPITLTANSISAPTSIPTITTAGGNGIDFYPSGATVPIPPPRGIEVLDDVSNTAVYLNDRGDLRLRRRNPDSVRLNLQLGIDITEQLRLRSAFASYLRNLNIELSYSKKILDMMMKTRGIEVFNVKIGDIVMVKSTRQTERNVYEVVGFRNPEIMVSPLGFERRGHVRRYVKGDLFTVGSSWPKDEEVEVVDSKEFMFITGRETKKEFYSKFQIGVEIEGEFFKSRDKAVSVTSGYFDGQIVEDSSIYHQASGHLYEINSPLIDSPLKEYKFIQNMGLLALEGKPFFAFRNNTAGTHVHFDFNNKNSDWFYSKYKIPKLRGITVSEYLRFLDSVEFEKYFFRKYFEFFKMKKFWGRLSNNYCKAFLRRNGLVSLDENTAPIDIEADKAQTGKYKWLNFNSLQRDMGIEFRIFPYLTTKVGIKNVIEFTQVVVMSYIEENGSHEKFMELFKLFKMAVDRNSNELPFDQLTEDGRKKAYDFFKSPYVSISLCSYDGAVFFNSLKKKLELGKMKHV